VCAAELAHGVVELLGLLEVAEVTAAGDHYEFRVRDRLLELACDAEWRTCVEFAPDQQRRHGDAGQQVALVDLGHHGQLRPEARGADTGGDLLEQQDELGGRVAGEQPWEGGIEVLGGRCEHLTRARDP